MQPSRRRPSATARVSVLLLFALLLFTQHSRALGPDPAARGLDVFLHVPTTTTGGATLELTAEAFGFPVVTHAVPLVGATIEAGWDPEELGGTPPPPGVTATTDAEGRASLRVDVPRGLPRDLKLLVAVRHGGHSRTREVKMARVPSASVELHTAETRVVPTSTVPAWVRVVGAAGEPLADAPVTVSLLEGGVARHRQSLRTDRGGMVMARVPIPSIEEPVWQWTLRAEAEGTGGPPSDITLTPREENPGTPTLRAAWDTPPSGVLPGDHVPFAIRLRDATRQPIVGHDIRYWVGVKGTTPPEGDEWKRLALRAATDGAGEVTGKRDAPTLVKTSGSALVLVARGEVEGHALEARTEVSVGLPTASATLTPETAAIVPGLAQRMMLTVTDGRGDGIASRFRVAGDGLSTIVTTDARGEAELWWNVPAGVGAMRNVGPCAGGVAAAVTIHADGDVPALRTQRDGFTLCLPIDREAGGLVRVEPNVARPGDKVKITVTRMQPHGAPRFSAVLRSSDRAQAAASWLASHPDGTATGEIALPKDAAGGTWSLSVAMPDGAEKTRVLTASLLVVPTVAPLLEAKRTGGRATPGGTIEVEARLTDGHGHGLPGAVSTIVADAFGGGHANVSSLDTRTTLCGAVAIEEERCTGVLEREPATDAIRRSLFGRLTKTPLSPANDPGAHASVELKKAFQDVLKSLEGAVFEAAKDPQTLLDVRRRENGRWVFNPELLTLVTDAMNEPPMTPGGERLTLPDLVAVDPQVSFDVVGRRVTRLKLFRVLAAVRDVRAKGGLDPDEPVFNDPNALVRRLVRSGALGEDVLVDPWGGTIQFIRAAGPPVPFLSTIRGWELHAPGPDGVVGTADDVRDPFERVVRSKTPYAEAVEEDRLVDAKWDMVVSEDSVRAWQQLFEELTGTQLGAGLGLSGVGEGGGGSGYGTGLGRIGTIGHGMGRSSSGVATGEGYWSAPVRTDAEGRVHLSIPLGDAETTWRVALVGVPDGLGPASTMVAVASELPLSVRASGGARWIEGDVVETQVTIRNRTADKLRVTVSAVADGAAALDDPKRGSKALKTLDQTVDVPAKGARNVFVRVKAARAGEGKLDVTARAPGVPDDVLHHTWEIAPAGESRALTKTQWVDGEAKLGLELDHGYRVEGTPRIVLERGFDDAIAAALESLEPERQSSTVALVDAFDAAFRIERWATTRPGPRHAALAAIAHQSADRALGRYHVYAALDQASGKPERGSWTIHARVRALTKEEPRGKADGDQCPPADEQALDAEPAPNAAVLPCWGAYVSDATRALMNDDDPERLASAILALADRSHRAAIVASLVDRLRRVVALRSSGDVTGVRDRAQRTLVYAALLRGSRFGSSPASPDTLFGKLAVLRDMTGGYGSSAATLAVVRALLASQLEGHGTTRARVRFVGSGPGPGAGAGATVDRRVDVPESSFVTLPLPPGALDVQVETEGPGLVARFERPVLRMWSRPPPAQESPVGFDVVWPAEATGRSTATLRVNLRHGFVDPHEIDVRIPLPPGVTLAAPTTGAAQIQGVLFVRQWVDRTGAVVEVPLRFGLAGRFTVPEATARIARAPSAAAVAPARPLSVQ